MAAGEYGSVSSQTDIEKSNLAREMQELEDTPEEELIELAKIYENRGLKTETALEVAKQLVAYNALKAHALYELGVMDITEARPLQAALSSGVAFTIGGLLHVSVAYLTPLDRIEYIQYIFAIIFLAFLGAILARTGGSKILKPILQITFWGTLAMGITALIGYIFNVNVV